jgi:hypothetical protein
LTTQLTLAGAAYKKRLPSNGTTSATGTPARFNCSAHQHDRVGAERMADQNVGPGSPARYFLCDGAEDGLLD